MYEAAWFICNLLLKTQNMPEMLVFLLIFWNIKKAEWLFFSHQIYVESLELQWSVPASELCLQLVFFELFEEKWLRLVKQLILGVYTKIGIARSFK